MIKLVQILMLFLVSVSPFVRGDQGLSSVDLKPLGVHQTYSFEKGLEEVSDSLRMSEAHYITGFSSLRWTWRNPSDSLQIRVPVKYKKPDRSATKAKAVRTIFRVWIYSETRQGGALRFKFLKAGKECCSAEFNLDFVGWRLMSYPFDVMEGDPFELMDEIAVIPVGTNEGIVYLDALSPNVMEDVRWSWPDYHQRFERKEKVTTLDINGAASERLAKLPLAAKHARSISHVKEKIKSPIKCRYSEAEVRKLENYIESLNIVKDNRGIRGKHLTAANLLQPGENLRHYFEKLLLLAKQCCSVSDFQIKTTLSAKFILMVEHLLDQGWQEGSGMGALHHSGYLSRDFAPAVLLMENELRSHQLLQPCVRLMFWLGRDFLDFTQPISKQDRVVQRAFFQRSADYLLTFLNTHLTACLLLEDSQLKSRLLNDFCLTLNETILCENGMIKNDGSLFHHKMHYAGYGLRAVDSVVRLASTLDGSCFEISDGSFQRLKMAVLKAEKWGYPYAGPIATGRHPLIYHSQKQLKRMCLRLSKSVPQSDEIDFELAQAYCRISGKSFKAVYGFEDTIKALEGFWTMNYAAAGLYKYGSYSVQLKGSHSSVKSHETYKHDNRYGRYLGLGSVFVFNDTLSGYSYDGWDWSQIPGTTSLKIPHEVLEGYKSFYGWRPPQQSTFSGSAHLDNEYGMFVFKNRAGTHDQSIDLNQSVLAVKNMLICLGSGVNGSSNDYPLVTNLFQRSIKSFEEKIRSSEHDLGKMTEGFYSKTIEKPTWLIDSIGTGYVLPTLEDVKLNVEKKLQCSLHDKKCSPTHGIFSKAYLDYGLKPQNMGYEYLMLLGATPQTIEEYAELKFYHVTRKDNEAHSLYIPSENLRVYALFGEQKALFEDDLIHSCDSGLILFLKKEPGSKLRISATHPVITNTNDLATERDTKSIDIVLNGKYGVELQNQISSFIKEDKTYVKVELSAGETFHFNLFEKVDP